MVEGIQSFQSILRQKAVEHPEFGRYLVSGNPLHNVINEVNSQITIAEELRAHIGYLEEEITSGSHPSPEELKRIRNTYLSVVRHYQAPGKLGIEDFRIDYVDELPEKLQHVMNTIEPQIAEQRRSIENAIARGIQTGEYVDSPETAHRVYDHLLSIIPDEQRKLAAALEGEPELQAAAIYLMNPDIEQLVGQQFDNLYSISRQTNRRRRRRKDRGRDQGRGYVHDNDDRFRLPETIEALLRLIPEGRFQPRDGSESDQQDAIERLRDLVRVKVERETYHYFRDNPNEGIAELEIYAAEQDNAHISDVCEELKILYEESLALDIPHVNPDFRHPKTGERGVLPSVHQRIGIHRILNERSFGIFDDAGTGKTAQAALAFDLIQDNLEASGEEAYGRAVVVCPNESKDDVWRKALAGDESKRVFVEPVQDGDLVIVNGKRDLRRIEKAKWIVLNYERLPTRIEHQGREISVAEYLIDIGFDYLVLDEVHEVKKKTLQTRGGSRGPQLTHSAAARMLTNYIHQQDRYLTLLTATPIYDSMEDYAVLYHMLDPERLPDPTQFSKLHQKNPRSLGTLIRQRTVRRHADEINDFAIREVDNGRNGSWRDEWDMNETQQRVVDYILTRRRRNWLGEVRKALTDVRLVDPETLRELGITHVSMEDSAKYRRLIDILMSDEVAINGESLSGPITNGEKSVVFSSMFKKGVTRVHRQLEGRYREAGMSTEGLDDTLADLIQRELRGRFDEEYRVLILDGDVKKTEREAILREFRENPLAAVLLCTTDTGGQSIDLSCASYAFHLEDDFSPAVTYQANMRLPRASQEHDVKIFYLRLPDTVEDDIADHVDRKALIQQIAQDGHPPTPEEESVLNDESVLKERIKRRYGGRSVDLRPIIDELLSDPEAFVSRRGRVRKREQSQITDEGEYESTLAQQVRFEIARNPQTCWHDPEFVQKYMRVIPQLSVYAIHRAKVVDLARRARNGELAFPGHVLSEGAGPGLLYDAYRDLEPLLLGMGFSVPAIVDRDASSAILEYDHNPNKVLGCMTGHDSIFEPGSFDMIDNESITLLRNEEDVKSSLLEANRILRDGGVLGLLVKNYRFVGEFYGGLESLGFDVLNGRNKVLAPSRRFLGSVRSRFGDHVAQSLSTKLANTYHIIARKRGDPQDDVPAGYFWFETIVPEEDESQNGATESILGEESPTFKPPNFSPDLEYNVDRFGIVQNVRRINKS